MKPYVTQVWPQFTADAQFNSAFGGVVVERVELFRTSRTVVISLRSVLPRRCRIRCCENGTGCSPSRRARGAATGNNSEEPGVCS